MLKKKNITLVKCKDCHLVQLNQRFNPKNYITRDMAIEQALIKL